MDGYAPTDAQVGRLWEELRTLALMWVPVGDDRIVAVVEPGRHDDAFRGSPPLAVLLPQSWRSSKNGARFASSLLGAEFDTNALRAATDDEEAQYFSAGVLDGYEHRVTSYEEGAHPRVAQEVR